MNKNGIKGVDKPRLQRMSRNFSSKKRKTTVIPIDLSGSGRSIQKSPKRDALNNLLEEIAYAVSQNRNRGASYNADSEDEENMSEEDMTDMSDEGSESEIEELKEGLTSDSEGENEK